MKGTVTISLDDYHKMLEADESNKRKQEALYETAKELSGFLSWLGTRENIDKYISSFNLQSKNSKIKFEGNKAIIEFREHETNNKNRQRK